MFFLCVYVCSLLFGLGFISGFGQYGVELGGVSIVTAIKNCNKDNDKEGDDKKEKRVNTKLTC